MLYFAGHAQKRPHNQHNGQQRHAGKAFSKNNNRFSAALSLHLYIFLFLWSDISSVFLFVIGKTKTHSSF